ncbi:uncharacterized protein BKA55DRAFT_18712 [Fusarium redolens]|uniref:Uncharacterized protein n=1 Tax=Fusarium redolens TaxID=48865 RepID=A0A9P9R8L6_FUSRE|nr:uncharacterized protein BKA55DRAFT_18712 [Fusarium redolens]KAH7269664.1 hypothetical protein BKA55DRAFT_18712 [Fusarium redolens]
MTSKLIIPVFRRYNKATLSKDKAILYSKLLDDTAAQTLNARDIRGHRHFNFHGEMPAMLPMVCLWDAPDSVRDYIDNASRPSVCDIPPGLPQRHCPLPPSERIVRGREAEPAIPAARPKSHPRSPSDYQHSAKGHVANLPPGLDTVKLIERRAELKHGNYQVDSHLDREDIHKFTEEIRKKNAQRAQRTVQQYHKHYFYNRPT